MSSRTPESAFNDLVGRYNAAVIAGSPEGIARALALPIPESILRCPELHGRFRRRRGNTMCRIGLNDAAEREYGLGFYDTLVAEKGDFLLDWAMAAFARLFSPSTPAEKDAAVQRCLEVLGLADGFAGELPDSRYLLASTAYIRAFLFVRGGNAAAAKGQLANIELPPLRQGFEDDEQLVSFFTQLPKGFFAALELKDPDLLRQVTRAALLASELSVLWSSPTSAGEQFLFTLSARVDTPKFRDGWMAILDFIHLLFPAFPITRRFRMLLGEGVGPTELALYIDSLHGGSA
jgi:hypothetical protein